MSGNLHVVPTDDSIRDPSAIEEFSSQFEFMRHQERMVEKYVREELLNQTGLVAKVPGAEKPILLKAGAQKIARVLQVSPQYSITYAERDFDSRVFYVEAECRLYRNGEQCGHGLGSYLSEDVKRRKGDPNHARKMACKRAFVEAILTLSGISHLLTQDLEDDMTPQEDDPVVQMIGLTMQMLSESFTRESASALVHYFGLPAEDLLLILGIKKFSEFEGDVELAKALIETELIKARDAALAINDQTPVVAPGNGGI